jgi:hypothetical protein
MGLVPHRLASVRMPILFEPPAAHNRRESLRLLATYVQRRVHHSQNGTYQKYLDNPCRHGLSPPSLLICIWQSYLAIPLINMVEVYRGTVSRPLQSC